MTSLEIMKRHLGKPTKVKLDGGDEIEMSPLKVKDIPDLMELQSDFSKSTEGSGDEIKVTITKKMSERAIELIKKSLMYADDTLADGNEVLDDFIASNFMVLMPKLFEINTLVGDRERIKQEKIAKVKKRVDESNTDSAKQEE